MKYLFNLFIISLLSLTFYSPFSMANSSVKVNFTGSIKARACNVRTDAQGVDLGMWLLSGAGGNFQKGSETDWVEFELEFNCSSLGRQIAGQFQGNPAGADPTLFELDAGEGNATGMAIQIEAYSPQRNRWEASNANAGSTIVGASSTTLGSQMIKFRARYKQLADKATGGPANASVTFVVQSN